MQKKKILLYNAIDKLMLIGVAGCVIMFILWPFLAVFKESIIDYSGKLDFSLLANILGRDRYLLTNSLFVAIITTSLSVIVSIMIAIYHFICPNKIKIWIIATLMLTMISPPFITSLAYINLFGRRGFITHDILNLSINPYGATGVILMQSLGFISLSSLVLIGVLRGLDKSLLESAMSLGAKTNALIKDMLFPLMKSGIIAIGLLTFIRSLADFGTPTIIGGAFKMLAPEGYLSIIAEGNIKKAAAINVALFLPAILVFIFYLKSFRNLDVGQRGTVKATVKIRQQGFLYNICKLVTFFFLTWLLIQYASIFIGAITAKYRGNIYFTLNHIIDSKDYIAGTFTRSIIYALIAGIAGSIFGVILVYYSQIRKVKYFNYIDFISVMPYVVPGTFFGLGYLFAFSSPPLQITGTAIIVVLNVLFKQLPFATKTAGAVLQNVNQDWINAVRDQGGYSVHELKDIIFPVAKNGLYISFINGFNATMTTIGSIIFLVTPGQKLATLVLFDTIQTGKYGVGSVIACMIILLCILVNGTYYLLTRSKEKN